MDMYTEIAVMIGYAVIQIKGDAVLDGKHTFVLILESDDVSKIENFMQPFKQAGPVEILPASTCEVVVERAGC